jgi:hypothetical protein
MTNHISNSSKFNDRKGLYCVWVPAHNGGKAPLISIWIDPKMTPFDASEKSSELARITEGVISEEIEDHLSCIAA